jgi:hypothetical protein
MDPSVLSLFFTPQESSPAPTESAYNVRRIDAGMFFLVGDIIFFSINRLRIVAISVLDARDFAVLRACSMPFVVNNFTDLRVGGDLDGL